MAWPFDNGLPDLPYPQQIAREPIYLTAGDTLHWIRSCSNYQATSGWSLTYYVYGVPGFQTSFTSTANGVDHEVKITAATTSTWPAGRYTFRGFACNPAGPISGAPEQHLIFEGFLEVRPNATLATEDVDTRTPAERMLEKLDAVLEGRAKSDVLESEVNGTKISRLSPKQLTDLWSFFAARVESERARARIRAGRASGRNIFAQFRPPMP